MSYKGFKCRIYPNKAQQILFAKTFGCVRLIYHQEQPTSTRLKPIIKRVAKLIGARQPVQYLRQQSLLR